MTDTTIHASAAPTTPHSTPVEWHTVDADDRWPGPRTPPASTRTGAST